jgi:tRNA (guanine37-N1)-methyltransferase
MIFTIYTLFPQLITPWADEALLGQAIAGGLIDLRVRNLRRFSNNRHNRVDDSPYGGGAGMVIRADVAAAAIEEVRADPNPPNEVILLSPTGTPLEQHHVETFANAKHLCLLSGRYEGFDARVESLVDRSISIGDFILMGGEVAALALIEATARLLPGVIGNEQSHQQESFTTGLLDHPEYTRPTNFKGAIVPEVLLSGHHAQIARWRREQALLRTAQKRPDLLKRANLTTEDHAFIDRLDDQNPEEEN